MDNTALLIIDIQNDYFPKGSFPLWNTANTLLNIKQLMTRAKQHDIPILLIQHISLAPKGQARFFERETRGADVHPEVIAICPDAPIIQKQYADSFYQTNLENLLDCYGIEQLLICGMMTQNCVTHTAISKTAEKYKIAIVEDCCTTTDKMIHNMALSAASTRVELLSSTELF